MIRAKPQRRRIIQPLQRYQPVQPGESQPFHGEKDRNSLGCPDWDLRVDYEFLIKLPDRSLYTDTIRITIVDSDIPVVSWKIRNLDLLKS